MQIEHGKNLVRVKISNQSAILRMIYYFGPIKRAEIAKRLELTLPTITTNVNNMLSEGIIREIGVHGPDHAGYGRKARLLEIVPEAHHFMGIETTGARLAVSITDYCGKELYSYENAEYCADYERNIGEISRIALCCLKQCRLNWEDIYGVCIALPGMVDSERGILKMHPRTQWNEKCIRDDFRRRTGYQGAIGVENNACVRALGAQLYQREKLENVRSYAYLFVDAGIACPLIVNNSSYSGSVVGAGEVGHMVMERGGAKCSCGNRGCLEAYSSDRAIMSRCGEALLEGKAPILREICGGNRISSIGQAVQAQKMGDREVTAVIENAIRTLGEAVANITNFTSPDIILIECKLFGEEENRRLLLDTTKRNLCSKTYRGTEFVFVEPNPCSGARGAAAAAINDSLE